MLASPLRRECTQVRLLDTVWNTVAQQVLVCPTSPSPSPHLTNRGQTAGIGTNFMATHTRGVAVCAPCPEATIRSGFRGENRLRVI